VEYIAYPLSIARQEDGAVQAEDGFDATKFVRLFLGQLPFTFTNDELNFALSLLAPGRPVVHIERHVNWKKGRAATGCAHAYCKPEDAEAILAASKRILFAMDGVYYVSSDVDKEELLLHAERIQPANPSEPKSTKPLMPSKPFTIERATSSYVPDEEHRVVEFVGRRRRAVTARPEAAAAPLPARLPTPPPKEQEASSGYTSEVSNGESSYNSSGHVTPNKSLSVCVSSRKDRKRL